MQNEDARRMHTFSFELLHKSFYCVVNIFNHMYVAF